MRRLCVISFLFTLIFVPVRSTFGVEVSFTVTSTGDGSDTQPGDGFCQTSRAVCTLRAAIEEANFTSDADNVLFNISGNGPHVISLSTPLPSIKSPLDINGYSQSGSSPNTLPDGDNAVIKVALNGSSLASADGLTIEGGGSTVRGLAIYGFKGAAIRITTNGGNKIQGNFIGTSATGTQSLGNDFGIIIVSGGNEIGGTDPRDRNIIAASFYDGVLIVGQDAKDNIIQGNFIGTDVNGADPNDMGAFANDYGIAVYDRAAGNIIGGTSAGGRNVISGNKTGGILIDSSGNNTVSGNYIGTDPTGTKGLSNGQYGVIVNFATNNIIGGQNLISYNPVGVYITGIQAVGNQVRDNLIGTDVTGRRVLGNVRGVYLFNTSGNTIGGLEASSRNIISGNVRGILLDSSSFGNKIEGNFIGTDSLGEAVLSNIIGLEINNSPRNTIGGIDTRARNIISGNSSAGIYLTGTGTTENNIQTNFIGLNVQGDRGLSNGTGIYIEDAPRNNIGSTAWTPNVISGNAGVGVQIMGRFAQANVIAGNLIGLDRTGMEARPNHAGIYISDAPGTIIGGEAVNIISANSAEAIYVTGQDATTNTIQGNWIGTDITTYASQGVSNGSGIGFTLGASNNSVLYNNIIGSAGSGIAIVGQNTEANKIEGNIISGGGSDGINIYDSPGNTVGGKDAWLSNTISGNSGAGIRVDGAGATGNVIQGNGIGISGFTSIPDVSPNGAGAYILTQGNTFGGQDASEHNVIYCDVYPAELATLNTILPCGGQLDFGDSPYVLEDSGSVVVEVVRYLGSRGEIFVEYKTGNDTATAGADYTAVSGTLEFRDGETVKTFSVSILDDTITEGYEEVVLTLLNPRGDTKLGSLATVRLTIVDDEVCGNGRLDDKEGCDDGNQDNGDECLDTCQKANCGDGFVWQGHEECDDGNQVNTDVCTNSCRLPACGDGFVQAGEDCDDGNVATEGCPYGQVSCTVCGAGCKWSAGSVSYCGDTKVDTAAGEKCDDGNVSAGDGCSPNCLIEAQTPYTDPTVPPGTEPPPTGTTEPPPSASSGGGCGLVLGDGLQ